jgi:flagellar biogenesis protein FliO
MHRVTGRRTIHDASRIAVLLTVIGCLIFPADPLAAQQVADQRPGHGPTAVSSRQAASPSDPLSTLRTPIRRHDEPAANPSGDERGAGSLWGTFITLGLILGGLYLVLRVFKRWSPSASAASQRPSLIEVIATRRLDAQSVVHLVRIGPRVLAVGASPTGLNTLGAFDDPVQIEQMLGTANQSLAAGALFDGLRPVRNGGTLASQPRHETAAVPAHLSQKLVRGGPHD